MTKKTLTDLAKTEEFKPTPHMQVWLDKTIELATDNKSEIARACNIDRNNFNRWLKEPGFEDWFYSEYKQQRKRWLPQLDEIGMKESKKGKFDFWLKMNEKVGDLKEEAQQPVNLQILNAIQLQQKKYDI